MLNVFQSGGPEIKDENDKRREIKDYFRGKEQRSNKLPIGLMAVGGLVLLVSLTSFNIIGMLIGGGLGFLGFRLFKAKPKTATEEQIDAWFSEDLQGLDSWARTRTGIDAIGGEAGEALSLISYPDNEMVKNTFNSGKRGDDGKWRVTPQAFSCFFFLENTMVAFQCEVDHSTGNKINERYFEFFYQDIVTVASLSRTHTTGASSMIQAITGAPDTNTKQAAASALLSNATAIVRGRAVDNVVQYVAEESFVISLSNGEAIPVRVSDARFVDRDTQELAQISGLQARVKMIRDRVREKKRSLRASERGPALI